MRLAAFPIGMLLLFIVRVAAAHPSASLPHLPLEIRSEPASRKLLEQLTTLDSRAAILSVELDEKFRSGAIKPDDVGSLGELAALNFLQRALGQQLAERGEAAGIDFVRRAESYDQRLRPIIVRLKGSVVRADEVEQRLQQLQAAHQPKLPQLTQRAGAEPSAVEFELLKIQAEFLRLSIWVDDGNRYMMPFVQLHDRIREAAKDSRAKQLRVDVAPQIERNAPGYDDFLARIAAATSELKRSGVAPWQGKTQTGPELIGLAVAEWQTAQQRALRLRAFELIAGDETAVERVRQIEAADVAFAGKVRSALADIVAADAARTSKAGRLYQDYVAVLGRTSLQCDREQLAAVVEPALAQLAARDQILAAEVQAYFDSTRDLLRWRRRVARAKAAQWQQKEYPALNARFGNAVHNRSGDLALLQDKVPPNFAALLGPSPNVLRRLRTEFIGQPCTAANVVGLGGGKSVARYGDRCYARFAFPVSPRQLGETAALRKALLVTGEYQPLTLEAATALAAAEQDCYERVGGTIHEVFLEPLLTRFATISDRATGLSGPDKLPNEPLQQELSGHVLVRCDLVPRWVQHECFTVELEIPTTPISRED